MAQIAAVTFDNKSPISVMAGPCVLEEAIALDTARHLKELSENLGFGLVFKASYDKANRQSAGSARGPGLAGARELFIEIKKETGLPIVTDIHLPAEADEAAEFADCLQIPAFLCRQTDIVVAAARTGKTVNIKKGQFLAPAQMESIVEKARKAGAMDVLVTERGASFGYNDLIFDPRSIAIMSEFAPVIFDASHSVQRPGAAGGSSGGDRKFIPALARAAVAVGLAGVFIETHPDPANALSDKATQWPLDEFVILIEELIRIDKAVKP